MKKILALTLASVMMYSCSNSIEDKKENLEEQLLEVEQVILEDPRSYEDTIDKIMFSAYRLKLKAIEDYGVREGYVAPQDFSLKINTSEKGAFISLQNLKTSESHDLVYIRGTTQLGDFNHRFSGLKEESKRIVYEKTKRIGNKFDYISKKWEELWFVLGL